MKNTDNIPSDPSAPPQSGSGVDLQRLVRIFARFICVVGVCGIVTFLAYGSTVVWERAQGIPLKAWLEAFGIVGAASVGIGVFFWAAKNAKF
jgi:hypothetical protein